MPNQDYTQDRIQDLQDRASNIKSELLMSINQISNSDFTIYKPGHAQKLKQDILSKPRKKLHALITESIAESNSSKTGIQARIYNHTVSKIDPDPSQQLTNVLRQQEIRSLLRSKPLPERKELVESELKNNSSEILKAIASSPDQILPTKTLNKYRQEFAYSQEPELENYKNQFDNLAIVVRKECGKLNSQHTKILLDSGLDDPITMQDHFQTFPPLTDRDKSQAIGLINRERSKLRLQQNRNSFDQQNVGVAL